MQLIKTKFKGLIIYKRPSFIDSRGYFRELFLEKILKKKFIFDYFSLSKKNVIRGLHLQTNKPQGKLITVLSGKIFDVCLDCRPRSKTFGKYFSIELSDLISSIYFCIRFVYPAIAESTTITLFFLASFWTMLATYFILLMSRTEVPPNFITIRLIDLNLNLINSGIIIIE